MQHNKGLFTVSPVVIPSLAVALLAVCGLWWAHPIAFYVGLGLYAVAVALTVWFYSRRAREARRCLSHIAARLDPTRRAALEALPFPVCVTSREGSIVWYNERFAAQVADGQEWVGTSVTTASGGLTADDLAKGGRFEITVGEKQFSLMAQSTVDKENEYLLLYYDENTALKETAYEYRQSRPAVLMIYIDNLDELMQNERESDRVRAASRVEAILEDWYSGNHTGIFRKYEQGRYLLVTEHRFVKAMVARKFPVLDAVRTLDVDGHVGFTLSIGVGEGNTLTEAEAAAKQALEMALGRGGDQAAVKHKNGFDFYGGVSKGVERRTKVRSRIIASALFKLMEQSSEVLVMGHRFSDADSLGSAVALTAAARAIGRPAFTVVDRETSLAGELIGRYDAADKGDWLIPPEKALELVSDNTLLIITDTHSAGMLESRALYEAVGRVVVIDHHRKMVDHIDNTMIFYHETYASSASEMVTELLQAADHIRVSKLEAEALLAGIMLDTRHFVMRVGTRTFEAAAALRNLGADTVEVKQLFAGSMAAYRTKAEIMAAATPYRNTVITCYHGGGTDVRIAAAQAADELLSVKGVDAAFALFVQDGGVNISARSLGAFNVQLTMEALGGGGHITMAGAYVPQSDLETVRARLTEAIDAQSVDKKG